MIFSPALIEKILAGEKTETRRPAKRGIPCRYRPGRTYAVQPGRGKPAVGRMSIFSVFHTHLGSIDGAAAKREGFENVPAFLAYWRELYGAVDLGQKVHAISFNLVVPRS